MWRPNFDEIFTGWLVDVSVWKNWSMEMDLRFQKPMMKLTFNRWKNMAAAGMRWMAIFWSYDILLCQLPVNVGNND